MIIRHAEKPLPEQPDRGVNELGENDDKSLTVRGWQRAGALTHLFCNPPPPLRIPVTIFASAPIKQDGSGTRSLRPIQTITSLAQRLGIEPDSRYTKGQEAIAGAAIGDSTVPTLACWQHESIPHLAAAIVHSNKVAPDQWDDDDYDSIWILVHSEGRWTFARSQQRLLPGDRP